MISGCAMLVTSIRVRDDGGDYAAIIKQHDGKRLMDAMRAQVQSLLRMAEICAISARKRFSAPRRW